MRDQEHPPWADKSQQVTPQKPDGNRAKHPAEAGGQPAASGGVSPIGPAETMRGELGWDRSSDSIPAAGESLGAAASDRPRDQSAADVVRTYALCTPAVDPAPEPSGDVLRGG